MEKAVFVTRRDGLDDADSQGFTRLYFGVEFCERLIPSTDDLSDALEYTREKGLDFSLVTPYVTDAGLKKLVLLFDYLKDRDISCEVVVNDWGVLNLINRRFRFFNPVLGRLLTKQKRGPKIASLLGQKTVTRPLLNPENPGFRGFMIQKKLPSGAAPYYKGANTASVPVIHDFLVSRGVKRIELDNTLQGLQTDLPPDMSASVYTPYVYITTTFFCPSAGCADKENSRLKIMPCSRECRRYIFRLKNDSMPVEIILKGNTCFYENPVLDQQALEKMNVSRLVHMKEAPL